MYLFHFNRKERDWVLAEFKAGRSPILIATDVASRGIGTHFFLLISLITAGV
jgi:ATP-dependent RNA helicase DDX5/DBP2